MIEVLIHSKETYTASITNGYFFGTLLPLACVIVKAKGLNGSVISTDAKAWACNKFLHGAQVFGTNITQETL